MTAIFTALLSFLCTPIGIVLAIVAAVLAGKFCWHVVVAAAETALIVAILGVVVFALGGFDCLLTQQPAQATFGRPQPASHQFVRARRI